MKEMKSLIVAVTIVSVLIAVSFAQTIHSDPARSEFIAFQHKYGKIYANAAEFEQRFQIFKSNVLKAQELDAKDPKAQYGVTKFMDMSPAEFKETILMRKTNFSQDRMKQNVFQGELAGLPEGTTFDWRNKPGVVTPVYNQGQCGSCWAFSITENIESRWALAGHALTSLSMQQVVSCDPNDYGCEGGDTPTAYRYVMGAGLEPYSVYPYASSEGESESCTYDKSKVLAHISSYTEISTEKQAQAYLQANGPLSVCVDAESWQYYSGGIITTESDCGTSLDHCVGITGYGVESGTNYWWVRNSWGTDWGQSGYLQVESGQNVCGIGSEITSSIV